jgi:prolyl-tRNA editing enzyme YbaK/EbsC (Cys-tRNA(Pro) deacylase)
MKIPQNLINHLNKNKVNHEVVEHKTVYTAYDTAQTLKIKMDQVVKNLLVKADKNIHLVVLTADKMLDLKKLQKLLKVKKIEIITEKMMPKFLKGKPGAFHPFASIYKFPIVAEQSFTKAKEALFPTGSFNHHLKLKIKDFLNLEKPQVGVFGVIKKFKKIKLPKIKKPKAKKKK